MLAALSRAESLSPLHLLTSAWWRWRAWVGKGALSVADEVLISGSNFMVSVMLGRWLSSEQYGAYALSFSLFLLLTSIHQALLLEPMSVFGPSLYADLQREYLGALLWMHSAIGLFITAALGLSAFLMDLIGQHGELSGAFSGLALAAPCILLFWTARSACYLKLSPGPSALSAFLYSALLLGGLVFLYGRGLLSPFAVFLVMAAAAVVVSSLLLTQLKPKLRLRSGRLSLYDVWREHWRYGRWALPTALVIWIPSNIFYAMTSTLLGMSQTGSLRAIMNITLPVTHSSHAFSRLFLPHLSGVFGRRGAYAIKAPVTRIAFLYGGGALLYGALFTLFHESIFKVLYGGKFMEQSYLVGWVTIGVVFQVAAYGPSIGLRAIQSPSSTFAAFCASAAVSVFAGIPATWLFGFPGTIGATALSTLTGLIVVFVLFRRKVNSILTASAQLVPVCQ